MTRMPRPDSAGMLDFAGDFETHLTVQPTDGDAERLRSWAQEHDLKYVWIVLDRGRDVDQPMVTVQGRGTLAEQRAAADAWRQRLHDAGFPVVRIKIEASPFNADVPQTAAQAEALPDGCYFEHHVKVLLAGERELDRVRAISQQHAAHVSRNARRTLTDGRHERFVTQRCRGIGAPAAGELLDALLAALAADGFPPIEVEREFVVVDDNGDLDLGWIDEQPFGG